MRITGKFPMFLCVISVSLAVGAFVSETTFALEGGSNSSTSEISASKNPGKLRFGPRRQKYRAAKIELGKSKPTQPATTENTPPPTICYDGYRYWNMANQWNVHAGAYTGQPKQANAQTGGAIPVAAASQISQTAGVAAGTVCYNANPGTSCYNGCTPYWSAPACAWNPPAGAYTAGSNQTAGQSLQSRIPTGSNARAAQAQQSNNVVNTVTVCYSGCVPSANGSVCSATPTCATLQLLKAHVRADTEAIVNLYGGVDEGKLGLLFHGARFYYTPSLGPMSPASAQSPVGSARSTLGII